MKGKLQCFILACVFICISTACGASAAEYVTQSTATLQPIIDQTRALCLLARDTARIEKDATKEAEVVRICTEIWNGWAAIRAIQDALALDEAVK